MYSELDIICLSFDISVQMLKEQIKLVDKSLESLITLAKQRPYFLILKSIPGVGDKLAVSIIAKMGDIKNFSSADKLVAFAGLDPTLFEQMIRKLQPITLPLANRVIINLYTIS